jgi:hypothetical protein
MASALADTRTIPITMAAVLRRPVVGGGTGDVASAGAVTAARAGGAGDSVGETSTGAEGSAAAGSAALMKSSNPERRKEMKLAHTMRASNGGATLYSLPIRRLARLLGLTSLSHVAAEPHTRRRRRILARKM